MNGKGDKQRVKWSRQFEDNYKKIFGEDGVEEHKEELNKLIEEITKEAKSVVEDFVKNPSEDSGSITQVHESSPLVATREERLMDTTGKRVEIKKKDVN